MRKDADKDTTTTSPSNEPAPKHLPGATEVSKVLPAITLPKGGGAIRGIGEKFAANPVTGTGSMTVPIATSPGRSGFGPQLSLSYNSGGGNGPFGFGWSLSLPYITRKTDKGLPLYQDAEESDVFILSDAEDLVPEFETDPAGNLLLKDGTPIIYDKPYLVDADGIMCRYTIRRYRPRVEGLFARIERWTQDNGDVHWRSVSKDNILTIYGKDDHSRIVDPEDATRIFRWLICETRDDKGNAVIYEYKAENDKGVDLAQAHERNRSDQKYKRRSANRYPKRIHYGNRISLLDESGRRPPQVSQAEIDGADWMFEVVFDYGDHDPDSPKPSDDEVEDAGVLKYPWMSRQDPFSTYRSGFEVRTYRLCQRVLMFHHFSSESAVGANCLVRSTDFMYAYEQESISPPNPIYTFLSAVTQTGYRRVNGGYVTRSLPPVEFEYSKPAIQDIVQDVDAESLQNLPAGLNGTAYQWVDLHGEGIPGILTEQADAWFYKRNLSPTNVKPDDGKTHTEAKFAPLELVCTTPNLTLAGAQFMDLAGDGQLDLVVLDGPAAGLCEHDGAEGWQSFRPFTSRLNRDTRDLNLMLVDLDGDGRADISITEGDALVWHASLAEKGFGPACRVTQALDEEKGPRLVFTDGTQSVYLADLSGDGLTDLVRIRNGEVCYWPNLGYGRFGSKVTMDNAPHFDHPDQFDHNRIRLADIDGSGTTDIIYLHRDGVRLYFNQSGNSWSPPKPLNVFPTVDDLAAITAIDLLGNGTACLVWSSPLPGDAGRQMRYVDLMGGQKPHLLVKTVNNLGAEIHIQYAPSTRFYLQDKDAGKPWITRLPFPVHVVERVETHDHISRTRFVTRYAYHHGYFDGEEREFRGFGMVEQWDAEELAALTTEGTLPEVTNIDIASSVPPVLTRTWFHTGAYLDRARISRQFEEEYYREGDVNRDESGLADKQLESILLDDTVLPNEIPCDEAHEACRALKGSILRQETYGLDGTDEETRPYTVSERSYAIKRLQQRGANRHAVFFTHSRETVDFHYERMLVEIDAKRLADPRVSHAMALKVDDYGNVERAVAIAYRRRDVPEIQKPEQEYTHITLTVNRFANRTDEWDWYRVGVPVCTRKYELVKPPEPSIEDGFVGLFKLDPIGKFVETLFPYGKAKPGQNSTWPYEKWDWRQNAANAPGEARLRLIEHVQTLYRPDDLGASRGDVSALLSLGRIESRALPGENYKLAYTPELLDSVYRRKGANGSSEDLIVDKEAVMGSEGGYVHTEDDSNWWIPSGRIFYHCANVNPQDELTTARQHFFLPRRFEDAFGQTATVDYDHDLLVCEAKDALDNIVTAENDYRVLQSHLVTDPNRNRTAAAFDALGMLVGTAVMGKLAPPPAEGDSLAGFAADLTQHQTDELHDAQDPHVPALDLLSGATTRIVYDLDRFQRSRREHPNDPTQWLPVYSATLARETHDNSPIPSGGLKIQISFSYSDGFGREIQKKIQAEPEENDGIAGPPRWVGSGWTIFNNKGKPVRQYEPFFSQLPEKRHHFEFGLHVGVSPILFYDPIERVVVTLHPNHTWEKVVFGPWKQETWDVNDTVTLDPLNAEDVRGFFLRPDSAPRLPADNYLPTWHALRTDPAYAAEAEQRWPDVKLRKAERSAAEKAAAHEKTPTIAYFDALGRAFVTLAHNGFEPDGTPIQFPTRLLMDIEGNQREVSDGLGRAVIRYDYPIVGPEENEENTAANRIHQVSVDAGERWSLDDITGKPIRVWDSRGHTFETNYDELRRPVRSFVTGADPQDPGRRILFERTVYGESHPDSNPPDSGTIAPAKLNLRGKVYLHIDSAGLIVSAGFNARTGLEEAYDFKGNLLRSTLSLTREYKAPVDWTAVEPELSITLLKPAAIEAALDPLIEAKTFSASTSYDALNRPVTVTAPDGSLTRHAYNEANLLDKMDVNLRGEKDENGEPRWTPFVKHVDYNAKGQRKLIEYGCGAQANSHGVTTTYTYDEHTFRLINLKTTRPVARNGLASQIFTDLTVVQDLHYTYDPAGNITRIEDVSLQTVFNGSQVDPVCNYTYDAIYRLTEAKGREHIGQTAFSAPKGNCRDYPFAGLADSIAHPNNLQALHSYTESYEYDAVGNILAVRHRIGDPAHPGWKSCYQYALDSNRLLSSTGSGTGQDPDAKCPAHYAATPVYPMQFDYDAHGNMTRMPHLPLMAWDHLDQLKAVSPQVINDDTPEITYYVYDSAGQRARKVTERADGTRSKERLYLGGFEVYREYNGNGTTVTLERESLHVMDDKQRIALVETRILPEASEVTGPIPLQRYQLSNHLGSASMELAEDGALIAYEEYHPYGTTAFQAGRSAAEVRLKRYRYTGKERDEETGLSYHGARYYACWLGRWTSCDPAGIKDSNNLFCYARANPCHFVDSLGTQCLEWSAGTCRVLAYDPTADAPVNTIRGLLPQGQLHPDLRQSLEQDMARTGMPIPQTPAGEGLATTLQGAWKRGSTADKVEMVATGTGSVVGFVPYVGDYAAAIASLVALVAKPSWSNAGNLGLDAVGALLPFVPALGTLRRASKIGEAGASVNELEKLGKLEQQSARLVELEGKTRAPVIGKAQKTSPGHDVSAGRIAHELSGHTDIERIYLNRSYKTASGTETTPRRLPDVVSVSKKGKVTAAEVPSPSDILVAKARTPTSAERAIINRNLKAMLQLGDLSEGLFIIGATEKQLAPLLQIMRRFAGK